jgi:hypothetical protein
LETSEDYEKNTKNVIQYINKLNAKKGKDLIEYKNEHFKHSSSKEHKYNNKLEGIIGIAKKSRTLNESCRIIRDNKQKLTRTFSKDEDMSRATKRNADVHQSSISNFGQMNENDLLLLLKGTESIHEQADILHYLFEKK